MRSSLLLLLLITTPCYGLSTSTVEAIEGEKVPSKTAQDELKGLSKEGLKLKIDKVKNDLENMKGEKTKIERELGQKRTERESAYQNFTMAERNLNRTLLEKAKKESTIQAQMKDEDEKRNEESRLSSVLSEAINNFKFPPETVNKTQYLLNLTAHADFSAISERVGAQASKIQELKNQELRATVETSRKHSQLNDARLDLNRLECSSQTEKGGTENPQCDMQRSVVAKYATELKNASEALSSVQESLQDAQNEQSRYLYLEAFHNKSRASQALNEAERLVRKVTGVLANAVSVAGVKLDNTRETLAKSDGELKKKEEESKKIREDVEKLEKLLKSYQAEYAKRPDTSNGESTAPSSHAMIGGLSGGILFLLAIGGIVAFLLIKKHRKKTKKTVTKIVKKTKILWKIKEDFGPEDARIFDNNGFPTIDAKNFKYQTIVMADAYEGDLPHKKANEIATTLPQSYIFRKDQLDFFFYGLPEDKPLVTGKKVPNMEVFEKKNFFRVFEKFGVDDHFQELQHSPLPTPQEFADIIRKKDPERKNLPSVPLNPAVVRKEFLEYLHAMASKTYNDDETESKGKFPIEYNHAFWIMMNAKEVMKKNHTSQLQKFNGSIVIVGDLNAQFPDLLRMFGQRATPTTPGWLTRNYLFLGDYIDNGEFSLEVVLFLLLLKILYPKHIMLQRGHHETVTVNEHEGFYVECKDRFFPRARMVSACLKMNEIFDHIPVATLINNNIYCAHGGIAKQLLVDDGKKTLDDHFKEVPIPLNVSYTDEPPPLAYESLWNDPEMDSEGFGPSKTRDHKYARQFGLLEYRSFKKKYGISMMFRGHQMVENGFAFPLDGTLVTTFSAPSTDGNFNRGATIEIHLNGHISTTVCARDSNITTKKEAIEIFQRTHQKNEGMRGPIKPDDKITPIINTDGNEE